MLHADPPICSRELPHPELTASNSEGYVGCFGCGRVDGLRPSTSFGGGDGVAEGAAK